LKVISEWSPFLPSNVDSSLSLLSEAVPAQTAATTTPASSSSATPQDLDDDDDDENLLSGGKINPFVYFITISLGYNTHLCVICTPSFQFCCNPKI